jgi:hypothetical protein
VSRKHDRTTKATNLRGEFSNINTKQPMQAVGRVTS